jgi:hypothetical protein
MKELLAREEAEHPHLFANILHAIRPILTEGPVVTSAPGTEAPGAGKPKGFQADVASKPDFGAA